MRSLGAIAIVALAACSPKVDPKSPSYDEELATSRHTSATEAPDGSAAATPARPEAPAGKGVRSGTIERARLLAVLDAGPGAFLRQVEVNAHLDGERFVGWQLVQLLDPQSPLAAIDLAPGDVLLAVNGNSVSRPDQLQTLWDGLRNANELTAELWRGHDKLELKFAVEPKL